MLQNVDIMFPVHLRQLKHSTLSLALSLSHHTDRKVGHCTHCPFTVCCHWYTSRYTCVLETEKMSDFKTLELDCVCNCVRV